MNTALKLITFLARKLVGIAKLSCSLFGNLHCIRHGKYNVAVNDGLSQRAEIAIQGEDPASLHRFLH